MDNLWVAIFVPIAVALLTSGIWNIFAQKKRTAAETKKAAAESKKAEADAANSITDGAKELIAQYRERLREMVEQAEEQRKCTEELKAIYEQRIAAVEAAGVSLSEGLDALKASLSERDKLIEGQQSYIEHLLRVIQRLIAQVKSLDKDPVAEPRPISEFTG